MRSPILALTIIVFFFCSTVKKTPALRPRNWEKLTKEQRKLETSNKEACLKVTALENKLVQGNLKKY